MSDTPSVEILHGLPTSGWRQRIVSTAFLLGWIALLGRLIQIQGAQRELLNDRVARQSTFSEVIPARPGEILDRNGHVLAMTVTRDSLYAIPDSIDDPWEFAWKVSSVLNLNADDVYRRIADNARKRFVWIKRRLSDEQWTAFRQLNLPRRTWGVRREYERQYPQGGFAAHVLGMRDIDNAGQGGLEESLHVVIRGQDGTRVMTRDALGIVMEVAAERSRSPVQGQSVISTIDLLTQIETERQLDLLMSKWEPVGACAIVMDPASGEILAMASRPAFDPNSLGKVPDNAWKNLSVSAMFEPGSTFKPFVVGWALQQGALRRDELIHCGFGQYRMGRRILHDHHPYGELSVEDVIVKSSNTGMAKIAERIGLEKLYEATVGFGFGRRTGIELPGELSGLVRPVAQWTDYSLGSVPMGQEIAVTPLQLITAHAALANGGRLVRPRLVRPFDSADSSLAPLFALNTASGAAAVESQLLDRNVCEWLIRHPMKQVVERGTGKAARIQGVSMFGKTGTAQKMDPETGLYSDKAWVVSFLCGAPAEEPRVLVLLMVDEPTAEGSHFGGTVAAPTAAAILKYALDRHQSFSSSQETL